MTSLAQRLRELSRNQFESLVHHFLLAKFPGADIKKVEGTGGDQGIDSFSGTLADGPAVWQSKHFPNRIQKSQKKQILRSIESAFKFRKLARWTLCVPIDLRTEEHEWLQSDVFNNYKGHCTIELIQASDILAELIHNRPLRNAFFPDHSISNALRIQQIAINNQDPSMEQKGQLTVEYAQQFLEGYSDIEPRLEPIVSVGLSRAPGVNRGSPRPVFSVMRDGMATDFFPRDPKTYNLDPIRFQMTLNRTHSDGLETAMNTGAPLMLPAGAILELDSSSPLLRYFFQADDPRRMQLEVRPLVPGRLASKEIPLRLVAGLPSMTNELSCIPFRITQFGRQEVTLISSSHLPVEISIKLRLLMGQGATINVRPLIPGADASNLSRVFQFLDVLEQSRQLEVFSLDPPGTLLREVGSFTRRLDIPSGLKKLVFDTALISAFFKTPLRIPEHVTNADLENIQTLKRIATGEPFAGIDITASLVKNYDYQENVLLFLSGVPISIRMENPTGWQEVSLFGETIDCGPVILVANEAVIADGEESLRAYLAASEGTAISWKASCKGSCRFFAVTSSPKYGQQSFLG